MTHPTQDSLHADCEPTPLALDLDSPERSRGNKSSESEARKGEPWESDVLRSEAWKRLIGEKPIAARLSTLPESHLGWSALATSTAFQSVSVILLIALPVLFPQTLATRMAYEVTPVAALDTAVPIELKRPKARVKLEPVPSPPISSPIDAPQHVAKLIAPILLVPPKPKPVTIEKQNIPQVDQVLTEAKFEALISEPVRRREPVRTGNLTTDSGVSTTMSQSAERAVGRIQTGAFGDPNGPNKSSDSGIPNKPGQVALVGSLDLSAGSGFSNDAGGAKAVRGSVASANFGDASAVSPTDGSSGTHGSVVSSGFTTAAVSSAAPKPRQTEVAPAVQPVVILAKPKPVYSDEAHNLGVEGEVLIDVVFPVSGQVQIVRVVKGLGHGLDEAAVRAAQQIRFQPALQNGKPVDFPATVHIVFQLAF